MFSLFRQLSGAMASLAAITSAVAAAAADNPQIEVSAGAQDRRDCVVAFSLNASDRDFHEIEDHEGHRLPLQIEADGHATFLEPSLKKNTRKIYTLRRGPLTTNGVHAVHVVSRGDRLDVQLNGQLVLGYQGGAGELPRGDIKSIYHRGGYLHPIISLAGKTITDDYPSIHLHHHGIWAAWSRTTFEGRHPDFWNMGEGTGTVEFAGLEAFWSGPVQGGFRARHRYVDLTAPQPTTALNETWEIRVYRLGAGGTRGWLFDFTATQNCAQSSALALTKFLYGGIGFRGNGAWNGEGNAFFLTSEGETDRVKGNATRARWCHISGEVAGSRAGIAILCHPDNFAAPQPMRIHPNEPFFAYAPSQLGEFEIEPAKPFVARYRCVVQDGPPDRGELDRLWNDYADPPRVQRLAR